MFDGSNGSELWLVRTCFDDDSTWNALEVDATQTRARLPEASLVVSSDQTQCHQRIRRIMTRLATRAQANSRLFVAIADRRTFDHPDRLLLTINCSPPSSTSPCSTPPRSCPSAVSPRGTHSSWAPPTGNRTRHTASSRSRCRCGGWIHLCFNLVRWPPAPPMLPRSSPTISTAVNRGRER